MSLYYYPSCGFCQMVIQAARANGVELELRNISEKPNYLQELVDARGRQTVPVLRIENSQGEIQWMPESREIVAYLQTLP